MKSDIIYKEDAIDAVEFLPPYREYWKGTRKVLYMKKDIIKALKALPSAEAVQGEWIKTVDGNGWNEWWVFKCSECGATIEDKQYRSWEYNFCPNCGARMLREDGEA